MQAKLPVLAATDPNTDIRKVIVEGGFGWQCESNDAAIFHNKVKDICELQLETEHHNAYMTLKDNFSVERCYQIIMSNFNK